MQERLESERYEVTVARDGKSALETSSRRTSDCMVLDVALPQKNGFDVCRDLRSRGVQTPILNLTARGQLIDRVLGLKLGADDYLTKPFEMMELLARIEALLRRARTLTANSADAYSFGNVQVDFRRAEVHRDHTPIDLSALELKLHATSSNTAEPSSQETSSSKKYGATTPRQSPAPSTSTSDRCGKAGRRVHPHRAWDWVQVRGVI